jgi:DNA-binding MarR family transcriptional regulator
MTKHQLLRFLSRRGSADAFEVAEASGLDYPAAAMALLRLSRQGLVIRRVDNANGLYWYQLSAHGQARLRYFQRLAR